MTPAPSDTAAGAPRGDAPASTTSDKTASTTGDGTARPSGAFRASGDAAPDPADASRAGPSRWLVACLCAAWCRTCDRYRATFDAIERATPDMRFAWIDIETHSDDLGSIALEVEDFPTVLIAHDSTLHFYGTLLPHAATLARTVEAARHAVLTPSADGLDAALVGRLQRLADR